MRLLVDSYSPDWETVASIPAYATSLEALLKRFISPISPRMVAPVTSPIPGIVVISELIFFKEFRYL